MLLGRQLSFSMADYEGFVSKITTDARGNKNLSESAVTVEIAVRYYKRSVEGKDLFEIDTERCIRRINGIDQLGGLSAKVRL